MKKVFEKWWDNGSKYFGIINYKKSWKENGNKPRIDFYTNGAKKRNPKDTCLDVHLIVGYTIFNYTDFNYWTNARRGEEGEMEKLKPCLCEGRPKVEMVEKIGIPSGDMGWQVTITCKKCGFQAVRWALLKSWAKESAYKKWNKLNSR